MSDFSRRSLLGLAGAGILAPSLAFGQGPRAKKRAKNIIFCVSDGMSSGVPALLQQYREVRGLNESPWHRLAARDDVTNGWHDTRTLGTYVPDSAAAATAWGSGVHVLNGSINMLADGTKLTTLVQLLKSAGMGTGLVTTASATHATPAGFAVAVMARRDERLVAEAYLAEEVDVIMGGGRQFFTPRTAGASRDLVPDFQSKGYQFFDRQEGLASVKRGERVLGIFSDGQVPYDIDRLNNPALAHVPSLKTMTETAIRALDGARDGFFLMVEGARVDHAGHANDFAGIVHDQEAFEDAVQAVLDFADRDGETLVIVTSDHGCGGPGMQNGSMTRGNSGVGLVTQAKMSAEETLPKLQNITASDAIDLIRTNFGITLTAEEAAALISPDSGPALRLRSVYGYPFSILGLMLGKRYGVGWQGGAHTSEYTYLSALGPGSSEFGAVLSNKSVFEKLLSHRGLRHRNPRMDFEEARRLQAAGVRAVHPFDERDGII